jgi:phosphoribosylaminoimidazolecarboxamide formyltransferase/IMP cyclohydrolase
MKESRVNKIRRALISVSDKTGVVAFARALSERGVEILSTGGTAKALRDADIAVIDVSAYTGSPEILDGRLKTLHPKIHGGLLGRRGDAKHVEEMKQNDIGPIDLVAVNLYPFEATIAKPGCTFEDAVENIDIGGPTMIRAAAKNHEDVASVVDPSDYEAIIAEMDEHDGALTAGTKLRLAKKVFAATARYDSAIITYLSGIGEEGEKREMPAHIGMTYELVQPLRYGENPHQKAAFYRETATCDEPAIVNSLQLQGKELSYNNIMDADAVIEMVKEFSDDEAAAVIVKHANPCGAAVSTISLADAFAKALECDPVSAFGGIIGLNRALDAATAELMKDTFFEVIAAPAFDDAALALFAKKKNLRLIEVPGLGGPSTPAGLNLRKVVGGLLVQDRDISREEVRAAKVVTKRTPTDEEWANLVFAWRICKHVKSNAIVYAKDARTLGIGAGQMSRVDASKLAVMKARASLAGSALASDAFFPFRDGVDAAAEAGATSVVQPGGSIRDEEVIAAADEHGMAMVFTGMRHFRH